MQSVPVRLTFGLLLLALARYCPAQPATTRTIDLSTPRAAAQALWQGIYANDADAVAKVLEAPGGEELTTSIAQLLVAGKRLSDVAAKRFGKGPEPIGRTMLDPNDLAKLDAAKVDIKGDTATIEIDPRAKPMTFHQTNGNWRLVVTDYANAKPQDLPRQIKLLKEMTSALNESAKELEAGKYATPQEAERYVQDRLHAVMMETYRPPTQPTTAPATRP